MHDVNEICFDLENYDKDRDDMWYDIMNVLKILCRNGYKIVIRQEDFGLTFIEFESGNEGLGCPQPMWLDPEEIEELFYNRTEGNETEGIVQHIINN